MNGTPPPPLPDSASLASVPPAVIEFVVYATLHDETEAMRRAAKLVRMIGPRKAKTAATPPGLLVGTNPNFFLK